MNALTASRAAPELPRFTAAHLLCCLFLLSLLSRHAAASSDETQERARSGNLLQWCIPLAGLGLSLVLDDRTDDDVAFGSAVATLDAPGLNWPGPRLGGSAQHDFLVAFVRMELLTYALKYSINAKRPNGGSQSFPSGHTAASFMGAEFIRKHYGNAWGAPAYLAASWVGYTRVDSHNHYWRDVIAGAALGIASNYDFDHVETPIGTLSIGLTTLDADALSLTRNRDPLVDAPSDPASMVLGLRAELRF